MSTKQVIVIRKDLNMRKGKMIAMGSHASMKVLLDMMTSTMSGFNENRKIRTLSLNIDDPINLWLSNLFTKICVSVNSEEDLLSVYQQAKDAGIACSLIQDAGLTEFKGVPTYTAVAVGPALREDVDKITGNLSLL